MFGSDQRSLLDRLIGTCLALLFGAAAVYIAVRLIEAIWTSLVIILVIAGVVTFGVLAARARWRDW